MGADQVKVKGDMNMAVMDHALKTKEANYSDSIDV
jgi:hypothetical protein